jgi:hypothetical protein
MASNSGSAKAIPAPRRMVAVASSFA